MAYYASNEPYERVDNTNTSSIMTGAMLGGGVGLGSTVGGIHLSDKRRGRQINHYRQNRRNQRNNLTNQLQNAEAGLESSLINRRNVKAGHRDYVQNRMQTDPLGRKSAQWQDQLKQSRSDVTQHGDQVRQSKSRLNEFNNPESRAAERNQAVRGQRAFRGSGRRAALHAAGTGIGALAGMTGGAIADM